MPSVAKDVPLASFPKTDTAPARPVYARLESCPIDLPTVIRLVNEQSPAVGIARAKVREAQARLDLAEVQWLPNLSAGIAYNRFDGQAQNQTGLVFGVSRANLSGGGGPTLTLDLADAIYRPLVERRLAAAERFRERATEIGSELDAVSAYLDLVEAHSQWDINSDVLAKAEAMLAAAQTAKDAKLDRAAGDVHRATTEVLFRKVERLELEGRQVTIGARLAKLLLLPPNVKLVPADIAVTPLTLIDPGASLDDLFATAIRNRPDLAANREAIAAEWARVRRQERGPYLPKVTVSNSTGGFGGGLNDDLRKFSGQNVLSARVYWEVKNFGFGNRAENAGRRAEADRAQLDLIEAQARTTAELVEAAQVAAVKYETLDLAERAVKEASELYRINKEGTLNVDAKNLFDALRPLQAIQILSQAKRAYLSAVIEYNRAQYKLFALLGYPPGDASRADGSVERTPRAVPD